MKIVSVSSAVLTPSVAVEGWALVTGRIARLPYVLLKVETDDGYSGIGAVGALQPFDAPAGAVRECIAHLAAHLIGRTLVIDDLMAEMARLLFGFADVRAAFEAAFYEIVAASRSTSIASVLGGARHRRIPVSRMVSLQSPELMGRAAAGLAADGYKVIKFKLGGEVDLDVERAREVRSAVGQTARLTCDANGRYDAKSAIRAIGRMDGFAIDIVEQPVPRDDLDGLRMVTHAVRPQVEADESAGSPAEIARLGRDRVVDSVVLRLPRFGGVRAIQESVAICRSFGLKYRFGVCFLPSPFQIFAAQVAAILPEIPLAHELAEHTLLDHDPFMPPEIRDGYLDISDQPRVAQLKPGETIDWTISA
jgi:L-alanine-DL-glutamate epimerase-like enolase superfamily enzyme